VASQTAELFKLSDLQELDSANYNWFSEDSPPALAGRCLLDVLQYLRDIPRYPGRFRELTNAHAIRLTCHCLRSEQLDRKEHLERVKRTVIETLHELRRIRKSKAPLYGDDFWDWAAILEAFVEINSTFPGSMADEAITQELDSFYESVKVKVKTGLTVKSPGEWYGPATAAIAHRILTVFRSRLTHNDAKVLDRLRKQALEPVVAGKYRGREVEPYQVLWHYGQVVAWFGHSGTTTQSARIKKLSSAGSDPTGKSYALARVLQGALAVGDRPTVKKCVAELYKCQSPGRPLGQGLMGENVKGSLNVLEAVWPVLDAADKARIRPMIDALVGVRAKENTVGVVVAVAREARAVTTAFTSAGAAADYPDPETTILKHPNYRVVVQMGKSLTGAFDAARTLVEMHKAKWVIMSGIAGSLGQPMPANDGGVKFLGPDKGDVVVAVACAPFEIRAKVREVIENSGVPFGGSSWMVIPTDPYLFALAHRTADQLFSRPKAFYEGIIVTGTGVKDSTAEKARVLVEFPGGLAVEEEGYVVGLLCLRRRVPFINIRGISDRAGGDKIKQTPEAEEAEQMAAASAAAQLTAKVVEELSRRW
jgi:nucleoside phosphorylase